MRSERDYHFRAFALAFILLACAGATKADVPIAEMKRSTVRIDLTVVTRAGRQTGNGSGFVVSPRHIVTNWHVCCLAELLEGRSRVKTTMTVHAEGKNIPAKVLWSGLKQDLAILELATPVELPPVRLSEGKNLEDGLPVWAVGYPSASEEESDESSRSIATVTDGVVSRIFMGKVLPNQDSIRMIQTTAAVNPGNSGGPLFNSCGEVIGVNHAKALTSVISSEGKAIRVPLADGINWTIQADELIRVLKQQNIPHVVVPQSCAVPAASASTGLSLGSLGMQVMTLAVALLAVFLAWNRRVRESVAHGVTNVSQRLVAMRSTPGNAPSPRHAGVDERSGESAVQSRSTSLVLRGVAGSYTGKAIPIDESPCILGRDPMLANLVFPADREQVSKRHCQVRSDGRGGMILEDLWSSNGTYLADGRAVAPGRATVLRPGDRFSLASSEQFEVVTVRGDARHGGAGA